VSPAPQPVKNTAVAAAESATRILDRSRMPD
jgi:hypothetical protein